MPDRHDLSYRAKASPRDDEQECCTRTGFAVTSQGPWAKRSHTQPGRPCPGRVQNGAPAHGRDARTPGTGRTGTRERLYQRLEGKSLEAVEAYGEGMMAVIALWG